MVQTYYKNGFSLAEIEAIKVEVTRHFKTVRLGLRSRNLVWARIFTKYGQSDEHLIEDPKTT